MKLFFFVGKIAATGLIGWLMLLNAQPWLRFADMAAPMIGTVPFLAALVEIPFLGGWIEFAVANLTAILGLCAWAVIQFCEILPMAYDKERILGNLIEQWQGASYDSEKEKNAALKRLKEQFNKIPTDDVEALETYRKWAYIAEFIGCALLYLPYEGGFTALIDDAPSWDADRILWPQLLMIPVSMFGFELLVKLVIRIWRLSRAGRVYHQPSAQP
jgi:hypothetical protein